jgi:hypothetical protein
MEVIASAASPYTVAQIFHRERESAVVAGYTGEI